MQSGPIHLPPFQLCQAGPQRDAAGMFLFGILDTVLLNGSEVRKSIDIDDESHPVAVKMWGAIRGRYSPFRVCVIGIQ